MRLHCIILLVRYLCSYFVPRVCAALHRVNEFQCVCLFIVYKLLICPVYIWPSLKLRELCLRCRFCAVHWWQIEMKRQFQSFLTKNWYSVDAAIHFKDKNFLQVVSDPAPHLWLYIVTLTSYSVSNCIP